METFDQKPTRPLRVSVLFFHPFPRRSSMNSVLWKAARDCPGIEPRDLYEIYPEFSIDVEKEQELLLRTDVVVFQHPFYWYSCPSLMKEWLDSVLEKGWAYGPGGDRLKGKYWLQAITTGGAEEAYHRTGYNHFSMSELLRPFEQSAILCGMIPLQPFLTHGAFNLPNQTKIKQAQRYRDLLMSLSQGVLPPPYQTHQCPEAPL